MFLRAGDTISGQEGKATAVIDGNVEDLFYVKTLEATFEKNKAEVKTLGKRGVQHKGVGWAGAGSMTLYYVTSRFRQMAAICKDRSRHIFHYHDCNDDPILHRKANRGAYNCNIDSVVLARLDAESDVLEDDIDFTFDDFDILDSFGNPVV